MIDIAQARHDTPACREVVHFNNAGAALPPQIVTNAMIDHLQREAQIGGYEAADDAQAQIERSYDAIAAFINCTRDEIAIVENATVAWDMVFYALSFKQGDRILTSQSEYASNVIPFLQIQKRTGAQIEVIPNDSHGQVDVEALASMLDERVKLIAISHVPTNGGLVQPAEAIGAIARAHEIFYLLDACQSVGQVPVDVQAIGCDALSVTGRKYLRGARGSGFLYVSQGRIAELEPPFLDLHAAEWTTADSYTIREDARRFENWESNIAAKIGLGVAVDYALGWGIDAIWPRVQALAANLRSSLSEIDGVTVRDLGETQCGIVTFDVAGLDSAMIQRALRQRKINTSLTTDAHTRFDTDARQLPRMVRASVHYYNTDDEIATFCKALQEIIALNAD